MDILLASLLSPITLSFVAGMFAALIGFEVKVPKRTLQLFAALLLFAIGIGPSHHILVDLDTEYAGDLLSDAPAAEARIPPLHLDDRHTQDPLGVHIRSEGRRIGPHPSVGDQEAHKAAQRATDSRDLLGRSICDIGLTGRSRSSPASPG